jgi:hypothetical protein
MFFLCPSRQMLGEYLKLGHQHFLAGILLSVTDHFYAVVSAISNASKKKKRKNMNINK